MELLRHYGTGVVEALPGKRTSSIDAKKKANANAMPLHRAARESHVSVVVALLTDQLKLLMKPTALHYIGLH